MEEIDNLISDEYTMTFNFDLHPLHCPDLRRKDANLRRIRTQVTIPARIVTVLASGSDGSFHLNMTAARKYSSSTATCDKIATSRAQITHDQSDSHEMQMPIHESRSQLKFSLLRHFVSIPGLCRTSRPGCEYRHPASQGLGEGFCLR